MQAMLVSADKQGEKVGNTVAMVVDGNSLELCLTFSADLTDECLKLIGVCETIVCCRSNPRQKALVLPAPYDLPRA